MLSQSRATVRRWCARHPHGFALAAVTLLATLYVTWNCTSWRFAYIGDDWPFYGFARSIA
ncbi:MAG: hypothetical protein H0X24_10385, partial [Ktedonobacterales bacterium]|nr:hypothetical protein [Ktedonobacterales bacterium]